MNLYFRNEFKGRGGWSIKCEVTHKGEKKIFSHYTTDSQWIDELNDLRHEGTWDEVQEFYHNRFYNDFEERIEEFIIMT